MRNINLFSVKYLIEGDATPYYASGTPPCTKKDFEDRVYSERYVKMAAKSLVISDMKRNGKKGDFQIIGYEFPDD